MKEYIRRTTAGHILGVDHRTVEAIAIAGNVRRKLLPGQAPKYHRGDIERIAKESIFVGANPANELAEAK
jgi:hypothetical protein